MLYQFGSVTFEVWPVNAEQVNHETGYDFVAKDVMGAMRPREAMGVGDEFFDISGRLFPEKFGGLGTMDTLQSMCASGSAHILVRGDGRNLGWYMIEKIREKSSYLDSEGVGKLIDFDINLVRAPRPSAASYISTLLRIFL